MIAFPNAKINIGLYITSKRKDGYHNLSSCFYPVAWHDILEILPHKTTTFKSSGIEIPGDPKSNLCLKAYEILEKDFSLDPVKIHLHKVIPIGAGLGGGSADGAFTIKLLNHIFDLKLSIESMEDYAAMLGSDCPFFIQNLPTFVEGTGDIFSAIDISLDGYYILLANPGIHISTKEAYQSITPAVPSADLRLALENSVIYDWQELISNDFEDALIPFYPEIKDLKEHFYNAGAVYASMTGSGSTVFGIFEQKPEVNLKQHIISHLINPKEEYS